MVDAMNRVLAYVVAACVAVMAVLGGLCLTAAPARAANQ